MTKVISVRADGRLCVHQDLEEMRNFNIDRLNMTVVEAGYVFRQIETFIRLTISGFILPDGAAIVEDFTSWPDEPTDDPKVCIVWNPNLDLVRVAVTGMTMKQAEIAVHNGVLYMDALSINQAIIWENEYGQVNERTNGS